MQDYLRGGNSSQRTPSYAAQVFLLRALVLLIVHALLRGRRWCRVRRGVLRGIDLALLWCDIAATVLSRSTTSPGAQLTVQRLMDVFTHDAALHAPAVYFIVLLESQRPTGALLLSVAAVLQRSTLGMLRGTGYYALVALSLRQLWIGITKQVETPPSAPPQLV